MAEMLQEAMNKKLMKGLTNEEFDKLFKQKTYPVRIPVELSSLIDLAGNPIVKKLIGSKTEKAADAVLKRILEAG